MSDELRAAAEFVLRCVGKDSPSAIVAAAVLAEHPADEDESVTPEWLGLTSRNGTRTFVGANGRELHVYVGYGPGESPPDGGHWCAVQDHSPFVNAFEVPTRGHVRRLLAALGVELKETP